MVMHRTVQGGSSSCAVSQYRMRVAAKNDKPWLHVVFPDGGHCCIPLSLALESEKMQKVLMYHDLDKEVSMSFTQGMLEVWTRWACADGWTCLPTDTLVHYIKACEYFLHEKHLKAACSTLGDRLFSCSRTELLASEHKPSLDTNNNTSPTPGYRYDITGKYVVAGKRSPSLGYSPQFRSSPNPSCSGSGEFMSSAEPISSPDMMSTPDRMSSPEYSPDGVCDYITSVEQVLSRLSDNVITRVLAATPPGRVENMQSVLPKTLQSKAVLARFPSISANKTLALNCEHFPKSTLNRVLDIVATLPPLAHLDVSHIPLDECSNHKETPLLLRTLYEACMTPMHVSLGYKLHSRLPDGVLGGVLTTVFNALEYNDAMTALDLRRESFSDGTPEVFLLGVEKLTGLQTLTISGGLRLRVYPNLVNLEQLTELRFSGTILCNPKALPTLLPGFKYLEVFELVGGFVANPKSLVEEGLVETGILRAAAKLKSLSDVTVGAHQSIIKGTCMFSFSDAVGYIDEFANLRRCKLVNVGIDALVLQDLDAGLATVATQNALVGEPTRTSAVQRFASALRRMPHLEDLSLQLRVTSSSTCVIPLLDALDAAGTSQSCTMLDFQVRYDPEDIDVATQMCDRLKRLTNLQHLACGSFEVMWCSHPDTLRLLATSLRNLTHLQLRNSPADISPQHFAPAASATLFLQTVMRRLTGLQFMEVEECNILGQGAEHDAMDDVIAQNVGLSQLTIHHNLSTNCATYIFNLLSLADLTLTKQVLAPDDESRSGGFAKLPESISQLQSLRSFSVECLDDSACTQPYREMLSLVQELAKIETLERLSLRDVEFSDEAAAGVAASLAALTNLLSIDMWATDTSIASYKGADAIAHALSKLPQMQHVGMKLSALSDKRLNAIMKIFTLNSPSLRQWPMCDQVQLGRSGIFLMPD